MLYRAWEARAAAKGLFGPARVLAERIALVQLLVAALAFVTAAATLFALRPRERRRSLHLEATKPGLREGDRS